MPRSDLVFDENRWRQIVRKSDWYFEFIKFSNKAKQELSEDTNEPQKLNKQVRHFFEEALATGKVALGLSGPDWDSEREPIDTIVIHHTSAEPGYRLPYMNATQLLNVYAPYFTNPYDERDKAVKGQPIWSGHFKGSQQIFYLYHWLMRLDGSFERLLDDDQIGWHAGNWGINKRSIAICIDNDYENQDPTDEILHKLADFIKENYPQIKPGQIIGHREARSGTICPGKNFVSGWKPKLLKYLTDDA